MEPADDEPPPTPLPVLGCRYVIGCLLLLILWFAPTFPWSGFLLEEALKPWGVRL
jgi:hypothetical protein